jgi:nicotinamide mononucleotide (NMN) deamidase PncC
MKRRRILLLGVAGLLCAAALLAIGILLVGRFGDTERRIMATTLLLASYGVVSLPSVVLLDQGRRTTLAEGGIGLAGAAAALAIVSVWGPSGSDAVGKSVGTATILALAAAQTAALAARLREDSPRLVHRLFAASCVTATIAAGAAVALLWTQPSSSVYARVLGALVVLDLLLVALQPLSTALHSGPPRSVRHRHT